MRLSTRVPSIHRNRNATNANDPTDHRLTTELKLSARPKFCNPKLNLQLQFKTREILLLLDIGLLASRLARCTANALPFVNVIVPLYAGVEA